jgi:hypothetical protein
VNRWSCQDEEAEVGFAVKVPLTTHRAIILALGHIQLESQPLALLEGRLADEADDAYPSILDFDLLADFESGHCRWSMGLWWVVWVPSHVVDGAEKKRVLWSCRDVEGGDGDVDEYLKVTGVLRVAWLAFVDS